MKILAASLALFFSLIFCAAAQDFEARAWQMENKGDPAGAREFLERASQSGGFEAQNAYARFLDRHRDPAAREVYEKALSSAQGPQKQRVLRRLIELDLLAGSRDNAAPHLEQYRAAGGTDLSLPPLNATVEKKSLISVPGPLGSFARMAAL